MAGQQDDCTDDQPSQNNKATENQPHHDDCLHTPPIVAARCCFSSGIYVGKKREVTGIHQRRPNPCQLSRRLMFWPVTISNASQLTSQVCLSESGACHVQPNAYAHMQSSSAHSQLATQVANSS